MRFGLCLASRRCFGRRRRSWNEMFVGVGDPIYNRADPRLVRSKPSAVSSTVEASGANPAPGIMELPRLLGSGREVDNCARIWQSNGARPMVLKGAAANKQELAQALRNHPSVVHVAAHMLFPPREAGGGMVALSLQAGSQVELLSDTETAGMRAKLGLVVLNGCSSGQAAVLPGAGLMGMSRAWLAAGAHAVILTRWPTSDQESGGVFLSLYRLYFLQPAMARCRLECCCESAVGRTSCRRRSGRSLPAGHPISAWKRIKRVLRDGCAGGGCRKNRRSTGGTW